jgi:hypothetical protein
MAAGTLEGKQGSLPHALVVSIVHRIKPPTTGRTYRDSYYRIVLQSARAILLQSARVACCKVPVDNLLIHKPKVPR